MRLEAPWALLALLALIPLGWIWWRVYRRPPVVVFSDLSALAGTRPGWRERLAWLPRALRVAFLLLAAVALSRPQAGLRGEEVTTLGVDIVLVLDRSGSMRALDMKPDRLGYAKQTMRDFIVGRPGDRIGLVAFAREAYTACPLTLDHPAVSALIEEIDFAREDEDGTAMGLGLAGAINRLRRSDARSRVVVLVTDGINNAGSIAPLTAADLARQRGIKVYTIGIGTRGMAPMPVPDAGGRITIVPVEAQIDEEMLTEIARATGGRYFRAERAGKLEEIFQTIDRLEKSEIQSTIHLDWSDRFEGWLLAAGLCFLAEVLLARWLVGRLP